MIATFSRFSNDPDCHFSYKHKFLEKKHCWWSSRWSRVRRHLWTWVAAQELGVSRRQTSGFCFFSLLWWKLPHWQSFVPQGDLATFGYRSAMKLEIYYKPFKISWLIASTMCRNMATFQNFPPIFWWFLKRQ